MTPVGDRLDEESWPLGLVLVWGHLGLAITQTQRDGNAVDAQRHIQAATSLLTEMDIAIDAPEREEPLTTRAPATIHECRGRLLLREGKVAEAIAALETAVGRFPHSRSYVGLALALEKGAVADAGARAELHARAVRLLGHATSLNPDAHESPEVVAALARMSNGAVHA
jgi:hypothetical protein